jgi:hypothetical protein
MLLQFTIAFFNRSGGRRLGGYSTKGVLRRVCTACFTPSRTLSADPRRRLEAAEGTAMAGAAGGRRGLLFAFISAFSLCGI